MPLTDLFLASSHLGAWLIKDCWKTVQISGVSQGHRQDFAWNPGVFSPGNFEKSSCLSPHFLHSESHFNPHSQIEQTFAAREGVWMHPSHPLPTVLWLSSTQSSHLSTAIIWIVMQCLLSHGIKPCVVNQIMTSRRLHSQEMLEFL